MSRGVGVRIPLHNVSTTGVDFRGSERTRADSLSPEKGCAVADLFRCSLTPSNPVSPTNSKPRVQGLSPPARRPALFVTPAFWDTGGPNRSGIRAADADRHPLSGARVAPRVVV